jgi:hypothetical protein
MRRRCVRCERCCRLLAGYDWDNLKFHEIAPLRNPSLEEGDVIAFHKLKAPI